MKALHGFSPVTAAAFLVAAIAFPVVLFPIGGVILANIIYAYGHKEYALAKQTSIFDLFIYISGLVNLLFILQFLWLSVEEFYQLIRSFAFVGRAILTAIPDGTAGIFFVINILVFMLCLNPALVVSYKRSAMHAADHIRVHIPNRDLFFCRLDTHPCLLRADSSAFCCQYI
jgi:hypothetical protein